MKSFSAAVVVASVVLFPAVASARHEIQPLWPREAEVIEQLSLGWEVGNGTPTAIRVLIEDVATGQGTSRLMDGGRRFLEKHS